jgi:hypothetical protein
MVPARPRRSLLAPLALAVLFLSTAACGGEDAESFRKDPNRVFDRAMQAVHDADYAALVSLMTKSARASLDRDLTRLRTRLGHAQDGAREREIARARLGPDYERELERATRGTLGDVLRFFLLLSPREARPSAPHRRLGTFDAEILYADGEGNLRPVRLVRVRDQWYVEALQL